MIAPVSSSALPKMQDPELRKAAEGFEAVFIRQVIGSMRKAQLANEMFGSTATENFCEIADAKTAESMAKLGQFGIADLVYRQLSGNAAAETGAKK